MSARDWLDELKDPDDGKLVEWEPGRMLRVGAFYWVQPGNDPDVQAGNGWEQSEQPARFAGADAGGKLLWNYLNVEGKSSWSVRWVGDEIILKPS